MANHVIKVQLEIYVEETDDINFDCDYVSDMISNVVLGNFPAETLIDDYTLYVGHNEREIK